MKSTVHIIKQKRGIDDLQSIYAFYGNSQGDETRTNSVEEYIRSEGWLSFAFNGIDPTDQEAIYKESSRRSKENVEYIEKLYAENKYGEEYSITFELADIPELDNAPEPKPFPMNTTNSSPVFMIFDVSNNE